jgi:thymidylate kinase
MSIKNKLKQKIVILGPDGAGKSSVIQGLMKNLAQEGRAVKMRHLRPGIVNLRRGQPVTIVVDPHGSPPRSALVSSVKILVWILDEWYANLFLDKKDELLICDRYYHDLLVDPIRYRYGGPAWLARLVGKLMPQPNLWVLLDAPTEVLQARKQEVDPNETSRQRQVYLSFVRNQRQYAIIDAAQPLDCVILDVERAITTMDSGKYSMGNK